MARTAFSKRSFRTCPGHALRLPRDDGAERVLPDLASRWQPDGPLGPSALADPDAFAWTDADWRGPDVASMVVQEIHFGTFTPEGTYRAAADHFRN